MTIRKIETESSIWMFDFTREQYCRMPKTEAPQQTSIPYTNDWEPYISISETDYKEAGYRILVVRPVPFGQGRLRESGVIISDTHKGKLSLADI